MTVPPPAYPAPTGAPVAPAGDQAPKLSVSWTGILLALGAIVAAIGTFLPFEKLVVRGDGKLLGTYQLSGIGSEKVTGSVTADLFSPGGAGKAVLGMAVVVLILGIIILAGKG